MEPEQLATTARWRVWARDPFVPAAFLLGVMIVALVTAGVWARIAAGDSVEPDRDSPQIVVPVDGGNEQATTADVRLTWAPAGTLRAPSWTGTVTGVGVIPGRPLEVGDEVIRLNDTPRLALGGAVPPYRVLRVGMSGLDVRAAEEMLAKRGWLAPEAVDGVYGVDTAAAVSQLQALESVVITGEFDPALVVWLPQVPFTASSVEAAAGMPAPPEGAIVATGLARLTDAVVAPPPGVDLGTQDLTSVSIDVRGSAVGVDPATWAVSGDGLGRVANDATPDEPTYETQLTLTLRERRLIVPASAVLTGTDSRYCVMVQRDGRTKPARVRLGPAEITGATVLEGLDDNSRIVANPRAAGMGDRCR